MIEYFPLSSHTWKSTEKMEGWWLLWCLWESSSCGTGLWNLWASWDMRYPRFHVGVGTNQGKSQKRRGTMRDRNTQQMRHIYFYGHVLEETREWISDFPMLVGTDFGARKYQAMSTFVRLQKGSKSLTEMTLSFQWQRMKPQDGQILGSHGAEVEILVKSSYITYRFSQQLACWVKKESWSQYTLTC